MMDTRPSLLITAATNTAVTAASAGVETKLIAPSAAAGEGEAPEQHEHLLNNRHLLTNKRVTNHCIQAIRRGIPDNITNPPGGHHHNRHHHHHHRYHHPHHHGAALAEALKRERCQQQQGEYFRRLSAFSSVLGCGERFLRFL